MISPVDVSLRGGARSFYESQATHPIYGETIPTRSIDEQTAYQGTLARIACIESQTGSVSEMPMMEMVELEAATRADDVPVDAHLATPSIAPPIVPSSASGENEQDNEQGVDPLAAEFGHNTRPFTSHGEWRMGLPTIGGRPGDDQEGT
jgi:hypothetical protein